MFVVHLHSRSQCIVVFSDSGYRSAFENSLCSFLVIEYSRLVD